MSASEAVPSPAALDMETLRRDVEKSLRDACAMIGVRVEVVSEIQRPALGETPLVRRAEHR